MNPLVLAPTTLSDTPPLDFVGAAVAAGYDGVGLRLYRSPIMAFFPVAGNPPLIRAMKGRLADGGLHVLDILSFYLRPGIDVADFTEALALGAEFGGKYALVIADDPDWGRMTENFARFCDSAAGFGMTASIEFAGQRVVNSIPTAARLIAGAGRPNAAICVDPLNLARYGGTPAEVASLDRKLVPYAQMSDGWIGPDGASERRLPGEGHLPLNAVLDGLPAGLPLSIEVPAPQGSTLTATEWAKHALDKTRAFLAQRSG